MLFLNFWLILILVIVHILVTNAGNNCQDGNQKLKCTAQDPRNNVYHYCMVYREDGSLRCQRSNVEKIPNPGEIKHYSKGECQNASALYIDDSCLRDITKDQVKSYPKITKFLCGQNFIKKLPEKLFAGNKKLKEINFCTNEIEEVHEKSFVGLRHLEILCLSNNKLSKIPDYLFKDLGSLRELLLPGNQITKIQVGALHGLRKLEILRLTDNQIKEIDANAFSDLASLTHLHLDENKLKVVNPETFQSLVNLEVLTMSYNTMEKWDVVGENTLGKVHTLNLASNYLSSFHSSHVKNMSKLQNLSLENNSLTSLAKDVFSGNPDLRYVDVSGNLLENIDKHTFSHLCHLEVLVLRNNELETPHAEWFTQIVNKELIEKNLISENNWNCNCEALGYQKFLHELMTREKQDATLPRWSDALKIECQSPENFATQFLNEKIAKMINESDCDGKNSTQEQPCPQEDDEFIRIPTTFKYVPKVKEPDTTTSSNLEKEDNGQEKQTYPEKYETNVQEKNHGNILLFVGIISAVSLVCVTIFLIYRRRETKYLESESYFTERESEKHNSRSDVYDHLNLDRQATDSYKEKSSTQMRQAETRPKEILQVERTDSYDDDGYTPMLSPA